VTERHSNDNNKTTGLALIKQLILADAGVLKEKENIYCILCIKACHHSCKWSVERFRDNISLLCLMAI
jgi:predicted metal-binding protein